MRGIWRLAGGLVAGLLIISPLLALGALVALQGPEALVSLSPTQWALLSAGLTAPLAVGFGAMAWLAQRAETAALRHGLMHHAQALDCRQGQMDQLVEEVRAQNELLREQVRLSLADRQASRERHELTQALMGETRMQRLTAEWDVVSAELITILAAMYRLTHGWRSAPGPDGQPSQPLPLPPQEELALVILRILPEDRAQMQRMTADERFVRQAARYRRIFGDFLLHAPETGPLSRRFFRGLVFGRLDARLSLLPRPDHGQVIGPHTLAAE